MGTNAGKTGRFFVAANGVNIAAVSGTVESEVCNDHDQHKQNNQRGNAANLAAHDRGKRCIDSIVVFSLGNGQYHAAQQPAHRQRKDKRLYTALFQHQPVEKANQRPHANTRSYSHNGHRAEVSGNQPRKAHRCLHRQVNAAGEDHVSQANCQQAIDRVRADHVRQVADRQKALGCAGKHHAQDNKHHDQRMLFEYFFYLSHIDHSPAAIISISFCVAPFPGRLPLTAPFRSTIIRCASEMTSGISEESSKTPIPSSASSAIIL